MALTWAMSSSTPTPAWAIPHSLISPGVQRLPTLRRLLTSIIAAGFLLLGDTLLDPTPRLFLEGNLAGLVHHLEAQRPPALSDEGKAQVMRSLPARGEVTNLSASQRQKLQSLQPLLGSAEHPAYEVKVIDVPQAFMGLYERAVLLLSAPALSLWTPEELQAIAAHEIGHEYVWPQYQTALQGKQRNRLQQLELYCDGVAILNLQRLGIDPSHLTAALAKGIRYNHDHLGRALNEGNYPALDQRRQFHRALIRRMHSMRNLE
jgi:hypothetical protein